ncbi:basic leucine zipper 19-like [Papaver somniferum]|uniref:basic leucine zipper 19-like n=1 Tax=Papaver somniferum TaxID=3469 RepID=UPI000E6F74DC|nr:basic leucine zipper 19-like [Papaver somniferum]
MDDGELDFSNQVLKMNQLLTMDSFLEDFLGDSHAAGTQTHVSNPTEQDAPGSQSYSHHRTKNHPVEEKTTTEETDGSVEIKSKKRAPGNRESVRKYRERKKARQALIEDELAKLRIVNQQLLKRLQGQVALEQEVARFKLLLVDIRGRIKGELGSFPYQKPTAKGIAGGISRNMLHSTLSGAYDVNQCDLEYPGLDNQDVDVSAGFQNEGFGASDGSYLPCVWNNNSGYNEFLDFGQTNVRVTTNVDNASAASKRRKGKVSNKRSNR